MSRTRLCFWPRRSPPSSPAPSLPSTAACRPPFELRRADIPCGRRSADDAALRHVHGCELAVAPVELERDRTADLARAAADFGNPVRETVRHIDADAVL